MRRMSHFLSESEMSRTRKGSKPVGYEYWSARPCNKGGGCVGKYTKIMTHRIERQQGKKQSREIDSQ